MSQAVLMDFAQFRSKVSKQFSSEFAKNFQDSDLFFDTENSELNIFCYSDKGYLASQIGKRLKGLKRISAKELGASTIRIRNEYIDWRF